MNLYLLTQTQIVGYDCYDSCIVCAENEEEAKRINPMGGVIPESDSDEKATFLGYWASSAEHVSCEFIGIASDDVEKGIVLSSYNAG